jgi:carboxypeptidase Taq
MRFELELALIEQELPVEELPQHWNQRLSELLGINQSNDSEGCLQSWSTDA